MFLEFFGLAGLKDLPTLREFTDLSDDSRALFQRRTGKSVDESAEPEVEVAAVDDTSERARVSLPDIDDGLDDEEGIDVDAALRDALAAGRRLSIDEDDENADPETQAEAG